MDVVMAAPVRRRSLETMNLSSFDATWDAPPLLLFEVKVPFIVSVSTSPMFMMKSWEASESLPSYLVPPFFSQRDPIILKSPTTIQGILGCRALRPSREARSLRLSARC